VHAVDRYLEIGEDPFHGIPKNAIDYPGLEALLEAFLNRGIVPRTIVEPPQTVLDAAPVCLELKLGWVGKKDTSQGCM
jgi:hypothetical protein